MNTENNLKPRELYLPSDYQIKKFNWITKHTARLVKKSDVYALIEKSTDPILKETIEYIYGVRGDLKIYDLCLIDLEIMKHIDKAYDNKIRKLDSDINPSDLQATEQSYEIFREMLRKYLATVK